MMRKVLNGKGKFSGTYKITNTINGKVYIGSAKKLLARACSHSRALKKGTHHNKHLQHAWNKYGPEAFVFEVIECYEESNMHKKAEQLILDSYLDQWHLCYNHNREVKPVQKVWSKDPEVTRAKQRAAALKMWETRSRTFSQEARANMSKGKAGAKLTKLHCQRISAALKSADNSNRPRGVSLHNSRPVIGVCKETGLATMYPTVTIASNHTGATVSHICRACKDPYRSAANRKWSYA